jgi:hypothetical protein
MLTGTIFYPLISVLGTAVIGMLVWGFKIDSRVGVQEQRHYDLKEFIGKLIEAQFSSLSTRLGKIEDLLHSHIIKE